MLITSPDQYSQSQRFEFFASDRAPLSHPIDIYWDEHSIPFIDAASDEDLAFGVGVVHAHLRLGQIELLRYVSQGRLSELIGPIPQIENIDRFLRTVDFKAAAENSSKILAQESRTWIQNYTAGLNWYIKQLDEKPVEHCFFNLKLASFTEKEVMTIIKFIGSDLTWATYLKYLNLRSNEGWQQLFEEDLRRTDWASSSSTIEKKLELTEIIKTLTKSGSNSLAIGGSLSATGAGLIANDPHVGLFLPNFWVLMGIKSPSYHAVGLMIPGVPFIGVGRNSQIAWGGTNMRGISSHLYQVSREERDVGFSTRTSQLKRRFWFSKDLKIVDTDFGPVINDAGYLHKDDETSLLTLDWVGRRGSDEVLAFLKVAKSRNWQEFRAAFDTYTVSAMNMLYADNNGNIGMVPAYGQPILKDPSKTLDLVKNTQNPIVGILKPTQQFTPFNPPSGYLASANNKPFSDPVIPYSFSYANNDRVDRLKAFMENAENVTTDLLMEIQQDIFSERDKSFKDLLFKSIEGHNITTANSDFDELKNWDGRYDSDSRGAMIYEIIKYYAWQMYMDEFVYEEWQKGYYQNYPDKLTKLAEWVKSLSGPQIAAKMSLWLTRSAKHSEKYKNWGELQLQQQKPMLGLIPLLGKQFRYEPYPAKGGEETLYKSGRKFSPDTENVTYGASARHISDLSSPDENYFVLHGGQDGWIFNENLADQTELWREGRYIKIPLTMSKVRKQFNRFHLQLKPSVEK